MRPILLLLPMLLAACGPAPQEAAAPSAAAPASRLDYPGKLGIPVRLDMLPAAEGGRAGPIAGAWRGEVAFDGGATARCGIDRGGLAELVPGSSHEVRLICASAVQLSGDGRRGFRVLEDGRPVASGVVLP
ncbi:hypothetical protein [Luteimonas sp. MC1750]|uniref:hypothetical protein n=1 Tax=Luteimonas sp. MC1750 TaxID=2799326 RepID=UPI0018F0D22F|nr:hypothetical protein [Luteimonas sp. MC1750]MBJ6984941.1 hypothetical protein [Luteimonas sp. MC1750]QQO05615.1 hypothetical protein JGR68_12465 [Luteimonas sp. MC1750]